MFLNILKKIVIFFIFLIFYKINPIFSEDYNFKISDFTYKTSGVISNIKGPTKIPTNKIIMSSLKGDTSVSGSGNLINIGIKYKNKPFFFQFENAKLKGKVSGNFKGNSDANYDNINFDKSINVKQNSISIGKKWLTYKSRDDVSMIGLKLTNQIQNLKVLNNLNIDWINHDEELKLNQNQVGIGIDFENKFKIYDQLDFTWSSSQNINLFETTNTGLKTNNASLSFGFIYNFQKNEEEEFKKPILENKRFIQISGQTNLATSNGIADTTENDYGGKLDFSDTLSLNGGEVSISSSINEISDSGWVISYLKGQKNANFSLQEIKNIFGANNNYSGSANANFNLETLQFDKYFLKPKFNSFQPYYFSGVKIGKADMNYMTISSYRDKNEHKTKQQDIFLAGLTGGVGIRKYLNNNKYIFSQQSFSYYNGKPFGTNLKINESNFNIGFGLTF